MGLVQVVGAMLRGDACRIGLVHAGKTKAIATPGVELRLTLGGVALSYKERCYHFVEGWWTYEFCVNKVTKPALFRSRHLQRHRTSR